MQSYVDELANLTEFGGQQPFHWWLRDFDLFVANQSLDDEDKNFDANLAAFLSVPLFEDIHGDDIVLDSDGVMIASRSYMDMDNIDQLDVVAQIDALENQRNTTRNQPINEGKKDWAFFTFEGSYCKYLETFLFVLSLFSS